MHYSYKLQLLARLGRLESVHGFYSFIYSECPSQLLTSQ